MLLPIAATLRTGLAAAVLSLGIALALAVVARRLFDAPDLGRRFPACPCCW